MLRTILLLHYCLIPIPFISSLSILHRIRSKFLPFTLTWYQQQSSTSSKPIIQFSCTSCGKCCKVDGDVWLSPDEVDTVQSHLGIDDTDAFKSRYGRAEVTDGEETWVCLRRITDDAVVPSLKSCVFLDLPTGQCSIYDVRPIQCATYPFWPSILASRQDWEDEAVLPDDDTDNIDELKDNEKGRYWTAELGGCEGIILHSDEKEGNDDNNDEIMQTIQNQEEMASTVVDGQDIQSKIKAVRRHWKRFPVEEIKQTTWHL
eukprot:scaffold88288_cov62-Cyclotella_meneghiniana.AAC.2